MIQKTAGQPSRRYVIRSLNNMEIFVFCFYMTGNNRFQYSGYKETGTYNVKNGSLELTDQKGEKRTLDNEWKMTFTQEQMADYVKADFSDSAKIIGEFNTDTEGVLKIMDENRDELSLEKIRTGIDNKYAYEILTAILP